MKNIPDSWKKVDVKCVGGDRDKLGKVCPFTQGLDDGFYFDDVSFSGFTKVEVWEEKDLLVVWADKTWLFKKV